MFFLNYHTDFFAFRQISSENLRILFRMGAIAMKKRMAILLALLLCVPAKAEGRKYAALTFDDGPAGSRTMALLEGLAARGVHATFFVCGDLAAQDEKTMRAVAAAGHEIGLHTCGHIYMHTMTELEAKQELTRCAERIEAASGVRPQLFRPPGGLYSDAVLSAAQQLEMPVILWSVDPQDWNRKAEKTVLPVLLQETRQGSILLMHELSDNSVACALSAIDRLQSQGYAFCTVSELAEKTGNRLQGGQIYRCFS